MAVPARAASATLAQIAGSRRNGHILEQATNSRPYDAGVRAAPLTIRPMVARWTRNRRATSAAERPAASIASTSDCCGAVSLGWRPPRRPWARAARRPAWVRSRTSSRSNSANDPSICIIMRPEGVVLSMFSVSERNPAPTLAIRSRMTSRS